MDDRKSIGLFISLYIKDCIFLTLKKVYNKVYNSLSKPFIKKDIEEGFQYSNQHKRLSISLKLKRCPKV